MKRVVLASLVIASTLRADTPPSMDQIEVLTPIDARPSTTALDTAFAPDPATALANLALSADPNLDLGVQLRAIRSLPLYPQSALPKATLIQLLANLNGAAAPNDLLRARAAIEAYGDIPPDGDTSWLPLRPFLNNASRDVRAATALALGRRCDTNARSDLGTRLDAERTPGGSEQVVLAISTALRDFSANCHAPQ